MTNIAEKLAEIKQTRNSVRQAIANRDATLPVGSSMVNYPKAIQNIQKKPTITILDNSNTSPVSGSSARLDSSLTGLAIISPEITDFEYLFKNSKISSVVNVSPNVTDMRYMFRDSAATELDLSSFDTSNVTSMMSMFSGSAATELDLSSFDTSNVTDMSLMFAYNAATVLDLSSFDTSKVTTMSYMFADSQIETVYVRNQTEKIDLNQ